MNKFTLTTAAAALAAVGSLNAQAGDWTANASFSNNYLWRGLTQTENEPAISGGIDYAHDSGFYVGTWVSNVEYAPADVYSYEHDMYLGYAGEINGVSYDLGWLYYNYDHEADIDFSEIYGSVGYMGFSVTAYLLVHTEADEDNVPDVVRFADPAGMGEYDTGFGDAYYLSFDYGYDIGETGVTVGAHVGYHSGDFVDQFNFFNGTTEYLDWNVSVAKGGFSFLVSGTDLEDFESGESVAAGLQNDSIKFVVAYTLDIDL